jgi:hypothetical protein
VEALGVVKLWRTLLFALVAVGLGAYIWLVEKPRMDAEGEPDKLVKLDVAKAARIRLAYPDAPAIVLEKKDSNWRLTEPIAADADDGAVENLVQQVADVKAERRIPPSEAEDLANYGLDGDGKQARVAIALEDGTELPAIVIGNTTPVGYQAYVRVDGSDEVVIVPLILHSGVKKTVFDLREKKLFAIDPAHGTSLTLGRPSGTIVLAREGDRWKLTAPIEGNADKDQVQTLLRSLNDMEALAFYQGAEVDRAKFGLDAPTLNVQAEVGDKGTVGFHLGAKAMDQPAGYYLERLGDGEVAKVPEWVGVRFNQDLNALRDKHLFTCEQAADVAKVRYERSDGASFTLVKDGERWTIDPPAARPLKDTVVTRTISGLASLAGKDIVVEDAGADLLATYGLATPVADVEVTRADGTSCGRAVAGVVGADSENPAYYLKRTDSGTVMSVPAYLYARMDMKPDDFLEPAKEPAAGAAAPATGEAPAAGTAAPPPSAPPGAGTATPPPVGEAAP